MWECFGQLWAERNSSANKEVMVNYTQANQKRKRGSRGGGRLFKKVGSKQVPADSTAKGNYYLTYVVNGKRTTQALRDSDNNPITDRTEAEAERKRILAPFTTGNEVETLKAIQAKLADAETRQNTALEQSTHTVRLSETWQRYENHPERPQAGKATIHQYSFQWKRFLTWILQNNPDIDTLRDVTTQEARGYFAELQKSGVSPATVNKHIALLRLVFSIVNTRETPTGDEVLPNPFDGIKPMQHRVRGRRELTTEELRRVVDAATGEVKLLLAIGIYTGLRLGDCATLRWDEVDLARGFIVRIPSKTAANGKVVRIPLFKTLTAMLSDTKPKSQQAYVLPETAKLYKGKVDAITDKVQRLLWNAGIDCHAQDTGFQIKRGDDGKPERTDSGNVVLTPTGKRAVVQCGFHSLRHTFVSLCREANAPLSVVEAIVGHSSPAMTRHYSHTSDAEATRAVASLPDVTGSIIPSPDREPLPSWAREIVEKLTTKNLKVLKAELLGDKAPEKKPQNKQKVTKRKG